MKIKHFLALALLAIGGGNAWAQTDVTSMYLTNADFEGTYSVQENPSNDRAIYAVDGWTVTRTNGEANDITCLKSTDLAWQTKFTPVNSDGGSQTYWIRFRWGDKEVIKISQKATLPAGTYKISADGLKNSANGTSVLSANGKSVSFTANAWETKFVEFTIYKNTEVEIALIATQKKQEESIFGYDNVKIEYTAVTHPEYTNANNLDFSESLLSVNVRTAAKDKTGTDVSGMQPVNGWIIPEEINGATDNHAAGVFSYESTYFNGGSGYTAPANPGEATGNTLGILAVWSSTTQYIQPVKFPAGSYTLNIPVYNKTGGTQAITNLIGFVEGNGTTHYATTTQYKVDGWTNEAIKLNFEEDTYGYISLGYTSTGNGSGNNPHLFVGGLSIEGKSLLEGKKELAADNVTEASPLLSQKQYSGTKSALQTAIDNINNMSVSITLDEVNDLIDALATAKTNSERSIADYAVLNTNITYAEAYTPAKIGATGYADAVQAAKDAYNNGTVETCAATIKSLTDYKVADYTWAKETYTEEATLGEWTNTFPETLNNEGYATGTTYYNEWGNNTRSIKQTVKLPAGDYILYGAGRGSIAAEYAKLYYKIGENEPVSVNYLMKGNTGLGIDTNGDANFSTEGTYTRDNQGMGWEYRFIAFTLAEETEVEIGTEAKYTNTWVSVYAPQLYTTEASVKALRLNEIAAALGAENANVPTGKMNATVASALAEKVQAAKNATISNTKDELATILSDLNDAIAAANTSVTNYSNVVPYNTKAAALDAAGQAAYAETLAAYNNGTLTKDGEVAQAKAAYMAAVKAQTSENAVFTGALVNPSFEEGTTGWTNDRNTTGKYDYRTDGVNPADGEKTLNAWADQVNYINVWQKQTLPAGHYTLSAKVRTNEEPLNTNDKNTQIRTYVNGQKTSNSESLTEWRTENWNAADAWNTLTTEFVLATETEVEMGIYSSGRNVNGDHRGWFQVDDFQLIRVGEASATITIAAACTDGEKCYSTYSNSLPWVVPAEMTVSEVGVNEDKLTVVSYETGDVVPANTGVMVSAEKWAEGTKDFTVNLSNTAGSSVLGEDNCLRPTGAGITADVMAEADADCTYYRLTMHNGTQIGFWWGAADGAAFSLAANKAYLAVPKSAAARVQSFWFGDDETAIEAVKAEQNTGVRYNMAGQRVDASYKGIVIVNGKKMLNK